MLASLMLRRLHLLSSARWVDVWTADEAVKIEWSEGPQLREVARSLIAPGIGLLRQGVQLSQPEWSDSGQEPYVLVFQGPTVLADATGRGGRYPDSVLIMRRLD